MTEERFDRFEKTMLQQFGIVHERLDCLESRMDHTEVRLAAVEHRMDGFEAEMSRQFKRVNKRLKNVEDVLVTVQHAIHDLSVEMKRHNKQINFLMTENLKQSQHLASLFKQEEHHDNRIAILFERMAVG